VTAPTHQPIACLTCFAASRLTGRRGPLPTAPGCPTRAGGPPARVGYPGPTAA